ncbi:hypothetical protein [Actinomadura monticuli]|uniref:Uncharacterized protein n=1 Tax=Actinomadura monticuli TaxID=3097367 RepID=A0ABV4QDZ4_9ACTN
MKITKLAEGLMFQMAGVRPHGLDDLDAGLSGGRVGKARVLEI